MEWTFIVCKKEEIGLCWPRSDGKKWFDVRRFLFVNEFAFSIRADIETIFYVIFDESHGGLF